MQNNKDIVFKEIQSPADMLNFSVDMVSMTHVVITIGVVLILVFITKRIINVLEWKNKTDTYIDERVDIKLRPITTDLITMKTEQDNIRCEQALNKEDIQDMKLQMVEINTSLKFIAEMMNDFRHSFRDRT